MSAVGAKRKRLALEEASILLGEIWAGIYADTSETHWKIREIIIRLVVVCQDNGLSLAAVNHPQLSNPCDLLFALLKNLKCSRRHLKSESARAWIETLKQIHYHVPITLERVLMLCEEDFHRELEEQEPLAA